MEPPVNNQTNSEQLPWHDICDIVSGVSLVGGSLVGFLVQNVAIAAVPISMAVGLQMANRRRLATEMTQMQHRAIAQMSQQIHQSQTTLAEQLQQVQKNVHKRFESQQQAQQTRFEEVSQQFEALQEIIADFAQENLKFDQRLKILNGEQQRLADILDELRQIDQFSHAIQADINAADAYYQRGLSHQKLGDRAAAIADFTEAIKLNPSHAKAYHHRGILQAELGNRKQTLNDLRQAANFYFEQADLNGYQQARDLSKQFYDLRYFTTEEKMTFQPSLETPNAQEDNGKVPLAVAEEIAVENLFA